MGNPNYKQQAKHKDDRKEGVQLVQIGRRSRDEGKEGLGSKKG